MLPFEVPIAGALIVAVVIIGYSRVFLAVSADNAVWVALAVAAGVFVVGTALASAPRIRTDLVAVLLVLFALVTVGLGITAAVSGERDFEHHGDEGHEESPHEDSQEDDDQADEDHADEGAAPEESN
jgi:hypothetical protein